MIPRRRETPKSVVPIILRIHRNLSQCICKNNHMIHLVNHSCPTLLYIQGTTGSTLVPSDQLVEGRAGFVLRTVQLKQPHSPLTSPRSQPSIDLLPLWAWPTYPCWSLESPSCGRAFSVFNCRPLYAPSTYVRIQTSSIWLFHTAEGVCASYKSSQQY